jgi:hypothetical protein
VTVEDGGARVDPPHSPRESPKILKKWESYAVKVGRWHVLLQDAIHEAEPGTAAMKIRRAEGAILKTIHNSSVALTENEEEALFGALGILRVMRSVRRMAKSWSA